jgi:choline dehydrogenase-like flavoprotein
MSNPKFLVDAAITASPEAMLEAALDPKTSPFDYIIVGSGAGGGPLAARLALGDKRVLLIEAGGDPAKAKSVDYPDAEPGEVHDIPCYHGASTEDQEMSWQYSVRHYEDDDRQRMDRKYDATRDATSPAFNPTLPGSPSAGPKTKGGIFYPRSSGIGGCTGHHAMIVVAPNDRDWNHIADVTGDNSWRADNMRPYFAKLERCLYLDAYYGFFGKLLGPFFKGWRALIKFISPADVLNDGGHGHKGWQPTSFIPPALIEIIAKGDSTFLKVLRKAVFSEVFANRPWLKRIKHALFRFRLLREFDPNDQMTRRNGGDGVFLIPTGIGGEGSTDENGRSVVGRRAGLREHLLKTAKERPDRLVIRGNFHVTRVEFAQGSEGAPKAIGVRGVSGNHLYDASPLHRRKDAEAAKDLVFYTHARGEVILCGGSFNTPQLLMLSGIGDRNHLHEHGISCRAHLPGVGRNLQDRYEVCVVSELNRDFSTLNTVSFVPGDPNDGARKEWFSKGGQGLYGTNGGTIAILTRSSVADGPEPDLFTFGAPAAFRGYYWNWSKQLFGKVQGDTTINHNLWTWVILKAYTGNHGGTVRLRSDSPFDTPEINFHSFDENPEDQTGRWRRDLQAVQEGIASVRRINGCNPEQFVREIQPGVELESNSEAMGDWIRGETWGHHACGTCRMGSDAWQADPSRLHDTGAVIDSKFRVHGVRGLRIVDASVFPKIPGYFILAPTFMVSEKAADTLLTSPEEEIYPTPLKEAEAKAVETRRSVAGISREAATVGLAISGGGVRSATFALGVLQALAKKGRLRQLDFLSSVSGGGFTASFFGRLFTRSVVTASKDPCGRVEDILKAERSAPLCWLQRQANYIFASTADKKDNVAIIWRNLLAVHLVLGGLLFALFTLLAGLGILLPGDTFGLLEHIPWARGFVISPWWWLPFVALMVGLLPGTLGYWLAPKVASNRTHPPLSVFAWIVLLAGSSAAIAVPEARAWGAAGLVVLIAAWFWQEMPRWFLPKGTSPEQIGQIVRNRMNLSLSDNLFIFVATVLWALGDTLSRTAAMHGYADTIAMVAVALAPILPWLRKVMEKLAQTGRDTPSKKRNGAGSAFIPFLVALGLSIFISIAINALAHRIFLYDFQWGWGAFVIGLAFSLAVGRALDFLNLSSLHSAYAARIARTYLGATNPVRANGTYAVEGQDVQQAHPEDDIMWYDYHPERHGGPVHLINVCINETVDTASNLEIPDRNGLPMCVGPVGVSVGRRFHSLWERPSDDQPLWLRRQFWFEGLDNIATKEAPPTGLKAINPVPGAFHVLSSRDVEIPAVKSLSLGGWTAVSGAAFSTGLGRNTTLARAFAMGFANVRLGYWWSSGILASERPGRYPSNLWRRIKNIPSRVTHMQELLFSEWRGRFQGPSQQLWYLSDGGHFDVSGLYELVRRRVEFIIATDAAQDTVYNFEAVADLGRIIRQDFAAEVEWLNPASIDRTDIPRHVSEWIQWENLGTLESIRRNGDHHAALARITYGPELKPSWLLLLKASLTGDEARDILEYADENPAFPQDATSDQVFNDPQWESYRGLGRHIVQKLITEAPSQQFSYENPHLLFDAGGRQLPNNSAHSLAGVGSRGSDDSERV